MTAASSSVGRRPRAAIAGVVAIALCAAACTLPLVSGLVASSVIDRILDTPLWLTLFGATAGGVTALLIVRRRQGAQNEC